MIKHLIILGSSYSTGERIGLHYAGTNMAKYEKQYQKLEQKYSYFLSFHLVETPSDSWESVINKDAFFKNVKLIPNTRLFAKLIDKNKEINGLDVANYILTKQPCCHTKLEKLVYLCYADYLVDTNKQLFKDKIYSFTYGPVVHSVYNHFKRQYSLDEEQKILVKYHSFTIRSRIISSDNGVRKICSIDKTLDKFGKLSAKQLVKLTHSENSPWSKSPKGQYKTINDDTILKYHQYELV